MCNTLLNSLFWLALISCISGTNPPLKIFEDQPTNNTIVIRIDSKKAEKSLDIKHFSLSESDKFSNYNVILNGFDKSVYAYPLTHTKVFNISYKKNIPTTSFLASPGDTVLITILGDSIHATNNREQIISLKDFNSINDIVNVTNKLRVETLLSRLITKKFVTKTGFTMHKTKGVTSDFYFAIKDSLKLSLDKQLKREQYLVDSLRQKKIISQPFAAWVSIVKKGQKVWTLANLSLQYEGRALESDFSAFDFLDDSLVFEPSGHYRSLLTSVYLTGVILKNNLIQFTNEYRGFDYRNGYDSSSNYLTGLNLDYVKFYCLLQIKKQNSNSDFKKYYERFVAEATNEDLRSYVKQYLIIPNKASPGMGNDLLITSSGDQIKFSSLFKQDKILYVDFWASWCKPCRDAMPFSKSLRARFSDKNVAFIYISIDTDKSKWLSAGKQEDLENYVYNFLLADVKEAGLIVENNLHAIPRYMVFDKVGKLINNNAPPPNSELAFDLLNDLLKEEK